MAGRLHLIREWSKKCDRQLGGESISYQEMRCNRKVQFLQTMSPKWMHWTDFGKQLVHNKMSWSQLSAGWKWALSLSHTPTQTHVNTYRHPYKQVHTDVWEREKVEGSLVYTRSQYAFLMLHYTDKLWQASSIWATEFHRQHQLCFLHWVEFITREIMSSPVTL